AGTAIAAASPWYDTLNPGIATTTSNDGDTDMRGHDRHEPVAGGEEDTLPVPGAEPDEADGSTEAEETPETETSPPPEKPTGDVTGSAAPSESSPSSTPEAISVPELIGLSEWAARHRLRETGLHPAVAYEGAGRHRCGVIHQSPEADTDIDPDSTVQ